MNMNEKNDMNEAHKSYVFAKLIKKEVFDLSDTMDILAQVLQK